ncbi:MAG: helix-turn-helix transcriptional regulator [Clostridia bacterium]|nr:helix-turn-helix transcriptional regulator [Clostridia bacterium]
MAYVKLTGLPKLYFAHIYGAEEYVNELPACKNKIEISYVSEGRMSGVKGGVSYTNEKYDVSCNLYLTKTLVNCKCFHEHHTTAFQVPFEITEERQETALSLPSRLSLSTYGHIHELIDEIIRLNTLHPERHFTLSGLFLQLLEEYSLLSETGGEKQYQSAALYVRKAKEYIYKNLHRPITQKEIARQLNITPEHLCAVFKKANDMPLMHFVNQVKLSKIREVMKHENLKLYEAAELYGYSDPNYVSRLFKKYYDKNITDHETEN